MSNVDFDNGFLCGLAVKGTADGGSKGKHTCPMIIDLLLEPISINLRIVDYIPTLSEE